MIPQPGILRRCCGIMAESLLSSSTYGGTSSITHFAAQQLKNSSKDLFFGTATGDIASMLRDHGQATKTLGGTSTVIPGDVALVKKIEKKKKRSDDTSSSDSCQLVKRWVLVSVAAFVLLAL